MIDLAFNPDDPSGPRRSRFWRLRTDARIKPQPWRLPLARFADREPLVLAERVSGDRQAVELGYESRPYDRELYVPVFASHAGVVTMATETASGFFVSIEHGFRTYATSYARMSKMFATPYVGQIGRRRQHVQAGEVIGYAAKSPIAVRFELWQWNDRDGYAAIDPIAQLEAWGATIARVSTNPEKEAA